MKKLAIIGNAKNVLEHSSGKLIDSCDEVLRINKFKIKGFEQYVGTKTTLYGLVPYGYGLTKVIRQQNINLLTGVKEIWASRPKDLASEVYFTMPEKLNLDVPIVFTDTEIWESLKERYKEESEKHNFLTNKGKLPPSGLVLIHMALSIFKGWDIYIKGFDLSKGGYYWKNNKPPRDGSLLRVEDSIIKDLIDKGAIKKW